MSDITYWMVFFSAALAINISPGPDLFYILSRTMASGKHIGMASSIGVGALVDILNLKAAIFFMASLLIHDN